MLEMWTNQSPHILLVEIQNDAQLLWKQPGSSSKVLPRGPAILLHGDRFERDENLMLIQCLFIAELFIIAKR